MKIAPSLLSANFANIQADIKMMENAGADYLHCDVMDGIFVSNITFGFKMIRDIRDITTLPLDVHLMIVEPERYICRFVDSGADIVTFHVEATNHIQRTLCLIKQSGAKAGIVLNPATPINIVSYVIDDIDIVLLMSVNPGFGGQKFIPITFKKIKELKDLIKMSGKDIAIEIDGGINKDNALKLAEVGADIIVAGSAIFDAADPIAAMRDLKV